MKIYTKNGDKGETRLTSGEKVKKFDLRIKSYGSVDELNSSIGVVLSFVEDNDLQEVLKKIQSVLFSIGSTVSCSKEKRLRLNLPTVELANVKLLESEIDKMNESLPPLVNFILPGGCYAGANCHVARTLCRRTERILFELIESENDPLPIELCYLNRLSDYLFVLSRFLNISSGKEETIWKA